MYVYQLDKQLNKSGKAKSKSPRPADRQRKYIAVVLWFKTKVCYTYIITFTILLIYIQSKSMTDTLHFVTSNIWPYMFYWDRLVHVSIQDHGRVNH